jgi:hypothetical protein
MLIYTISSFKSIFDRRAVSELDIHHIVKRDGFPRYYSASPRRRLTIL